MPTEPSQPASQAAHVEGELAAIERQIAQAEDRVRELEQQRANAEPPHKDALQAELAATQRERLDLLQRANTLRAQLDLPAVTPDAVPLRRRGARVYPPATVPVGPGTGDA